jgi:hypothetical protein
MGEHDQELDDFIARVDEQLEPKLAARRRKSYGPKMPKLPKASVKALTVTVETRSERRRDEKRQSGLLLKGALYGRKIRGGAKAIDFIPTAIRSMGKLAGDKGGFTTYDFAKAAGVEYSIWLDDDSHPILMYRDLTRMYGKDWLNWEAETLWQAIEEDDGIASLPRSAKDKAASLRVAVKTDFPWTELEVFENVAHAFSGREARFDLMQQLEPFEVAFALDVLVDLHPGHDIGGRVESYIAATLFDAGLSYAPPVLFGQVQDDLDKLRRGTDRVRNAVRDGWAAGASPDDAKVGKDPIATQLATLGAIRDLLKERRAELELTPHLPELDYDAEDDTGVPRPATEPLSAPARGEWLHHPDPGSGARDD